MFGTGIVGNTKWLRLFVLLAASNADRFIGKRFNVVEDLDSTLVATLDFWQIDSTHGYCIANERSETQGRYNKHVFLVKAIREPGTSRRWEVIGHLYVDLSRYSPEAVLHDDGCAYVGRERGNSLIFAVFPAAEAKKARKPEAAWQVDRKTGGFAPVDIDSVRCRWTPPEEEPQG